MSYDDDAALLREYQEWRATRKILIKDESVEMFLADRYKEQALSMLLRVKDLYDQWDDADEFIASMGEIMKELD